MIAMKQLISDYTLTPNTEISRDLEAKVKPNISFIDLCRSLSVSQVMPMFLANVLRMRGLFQKEKKK